MKRREFLKAAGGGLAATAVAAPAIAQSMPELKWRLTASWPKSLDTLYGCPEYMAKRIAEITDNKFQIQVFAAGEIVPGLQVLDAVQNGTVEMGHTATYYYFGKDPAFTFGTALPFGLNTRQQNAWQFQGGGMELLNDFMKSLQCVGHSDRQHHVPDGWLVPQRTQERRRHERLEDAHRRFRRTHPGQARPRSAAARRRRHLSVA